MIRAHESIYCTRVRLYFYIIMHKISFFFNAAIAACLMATPIITACSSDDEDELVVNSQNVIYTVTVDETNDGTAIPITEVADFYVNYADNSGSGQARVEQGKAYAYTHATEFPYSIHFSSSAQLKPNAVIDPNATYKINVKTHWELITEFKGTTKTRNQEDVNELASKLSGSHVKDYIERWGDGDAKDFAFDAQGNLK